MIWVFLKISIAFQKNADIIALLNAIQRDRVIYAKRVNSGFGENLRPESIYVLGGSADEKARSVQEHC